MFQILTSLPMVGRVFVDALDARYYEEYHNKGQCRFSKFHREVPFLKLLESLALRRSLICRIPLGSLFNPLSAKWIRIIIEGEKHSFQRKAEAIFFHC